MEGGEVGAGSISVGNNKQRILGTEWSMSKIGTPPLHNLDTPQGLVASINNKNNYKLWYLFLYFGILHSNSVILIRLCLVFVIFSPLFLSGLK